MAPAGGGEGRDFKTFLVIWSGQLVSLVGSGLTRFALGVWVYQQTGSATQFALISLAATFPVVVLSLFSGSLVDRWDRRRTLIVSDCVAAVPTLAVALLFAAGGLEIWHVYVAVAVGSCSTAFQWPAYSASITLLVPKRHLGRSAGMVELARAGAQVLAPGLAGVLMLHLELWGILLIDTATFLAAVATLLAIRLPPPAPAGGSGPARALLRHEIADGWRYLLARPGLVRLLGYFSLQNFSVALVLALTTPMMLAFTTPAVLGATLSAGALGMVLGGVALTVWGGPKLKIHGVLGFGLLLGAGLSLAGLRPSPVWIALGLLAFNVSVPMINGCSQAIWQSKVPPPIQGRIFAIRRMFASFTAPLGYLVAGPLADRVFEPLLAADGLLAGSVGQLIGAGAGRGIGLIFVLLGALSMLVAVLGYRSPRLVRVESELPDADDPGSVPGDADAQSSDLTPGDGPRLGRSTP